MVVQFNLFNNEKKVRKQKVSKVNRELVQLHLLYDIIYSRLGLPLDEQREVIIFDKIIAYPDERQAELIGTQSLSIKQRLKLHSEYVRGLYG